jgi:glycosyltransferase involved in cell wall biosynthesis
MTNQRLQLAGRSQEAETHVLTAHDLQSSLARLSAELEAARADASRMQRENDRHVNGLLSGHEQAMLESQSKLEFAQEQLQAALADLAQIRGTRLWRLRENLLGNRFVGVVVGGMIRLLNRLCRPANVVHAHIRRLIDRPSAASRGMQSEQPAVSVLILSFNQESYILQALRGLSRQRVDFTMEVVVADDCSHDRTAQIIGKWAKGSGLPTRFLPRPKNLGVAANFVDAVAQCRGRYVAILEGDDYWTDRRKLSKQYRYLQAHSGCTSCFHPVRLLFDDGRYENWTPLPGTKPELQFLDVLQQNYVPNCSTLMFRNDPADRLPEWLGELRYYDWVLHVCNAHRGNLAFLAEVMSVYRVRARGAWHGASKAHQAREVIRILDHLNEYYGGKYHALLAERKSVWQAQLSREPQGEPPEPQGKAGHELHLGHAPVRKLSFDGAGL